MKNQRESALTCPLILAVVTIALALRLAPVNRYVTPDEPAWVYRSIRFGQALAARDLAAIPDTGHPGVQLWRVVK